MARQVIKSLSPEGWSLALYTAPMPDSRNEALCFDLWSGEDRPTLIGCSHPGDFGVSMARSMGEGYLPVELDTTPLEHASIGPIEGRQIQVTTQTEGSRMSVIFDFDDFWKAFGRA